MSISALSSTTSSSSQAASLNLQDFLSVLTTQITYQDPLKPMDNQQFMAQLAQFTTLEQTQQINTNLSTVLSNQAALQSVGLIGKSVSVTINGSTQTGAVTQLSLSGTVPLLTIQTTAGLTLSNIDLSQITNVQ